SDAEALESARSLVEGYLGTFTIHTPYDISEWGDNYLSRTFPRALTGQLIHDCGVYALRVAYMLSLVRERLNLRFRFIRLPAHLGLIITSKEDSKIPMYLLHNNVFLKLNDSDLRDLQNYWLEHDEQGNAVPRAKKFDERKFIGSVAAAAFIPRVDQPFRLEDVPKLKGKSEKEDKAALWKFYHKSALL